MLKDLTNVDQDRSISPESFIYIDGVLSFDMMMDTSSPDITGVRLVFYQQSTFKFLQLMFTSFSTTQIRELANTKTYFTDIACSDDFRQSLFCSVRKSSGEHCVVNFNLSSKNQETRHNISCRMASPFDFEPSYFRVFRSYIFASGEHLTTGDRRSVIYRVHNSTSDPIYASGSVDLNMID